MRLYSFHVISVLCVTSPVSVQLFKKAFFKFVCLFKLQETKSAPCISLLISLLSGFCPEVCNLAASHRHPYCIRQEKQGSCVSKSERSPNLAFPFSLGSLALPCMIFHLYIIIFDVYDIRLIKSSV